MRRTIITAVAALTALAVPGAAIAAHHGKSHGSSRSASSHHKRHHRHARIMRFGTGERTAPTAARRLDLARAPDAWPGNRRNDRVVHQRHAHDHAQRRLDGQRESHRRHRDRVPLGDGQRRERRPRRPGRRPRRQSQRRSGRRPAWRTAQGDGSGERTRATTTAKRRSRSRALHVGGARVGRGRPRGGAAREQRGRRLGEGRARPVASGRCRGREGTDGPPAGSTPLRRS